MLWNGFLGQWTRHRRQLLGVALLIPRPLAATGQDGDVERGVPPAICPSRSFALRRDRICPPGRRSGESRQTASLPSVAVLYRNTCHSSNVTLNRYFRRARN